MPYTEGQYSMNAGGRLSCSEKMAQGVDKHHDSPRQTPQREATSLQAVTKAPLPQQLKAARNHTEDPEECLDRLLNPGMANPRVLREYHPSPDPLPE